MNRATRPDSHEPIRLLAGLAIQPVVAAGVAFVTFPVLFLDREGHTVAGGFPADPADAALSMATAAALVAVLVTLLGVLPTAIWLTRRRHVGLSLAILFGVGFGTIPLAVGAALAGNQGGEGLWRGLLFSWLLGATGGAVFWTIALRGREPRRNRAGVPGGSR